VESIPHGSRWEILVAVEEIVLTGGRMVLQLSHHGGRDGVTGSCHQLLFDGGGVETPPSPFSILPFFNNFSVFQDSNS
jgi:hypothetical protein